MKQSISLPVYLRTGVTHVTVITFVLLITLLLSTFSVFGQSVLDSGTPVGLAPGVPAGSYALSDVDNINLFSGNLNFTLPLLKISGRGGAQGAIMLPIESHWTNFYFFRREDGSYYNPIPMYNFDPAAALKPGYGPGVLIPRFSQVTFGPGEVCSGSTGLWAVDTQTRLNFIAGDGTQFELRDTVHDGAPLTRNCNQPFHSRGTVFVTKDGSAATFISDTVSEDRSGGGPVSGYLMLRDGTRYRIDNGLVTWIRDRNGNQLTYSYTNNRVTLIKDSLNREITIEYEINDIAPYGLCDRIRFKGSGGQERIIRVSYNQLSSSLASGYTLLTKNQMFTPPFPPDFVSNNQNTNFDTQVVSSVWLPDDGVNTRRYRFFYNGYGELARTELPTGGSYEYVWETTPLIEYEPGYPQELLRRVKTRKVINGSTVEQKTSYSYNLPATRNGTTVVTVDHSDDSQPARTLSQEKHYFYGTPIPLPFQIGSNSVFRDSPWTIGREYQTDFLAASGSPLLRRTTQTWRQRAPVGWCTGSGLTPCTQDTAPANDPRVVETITTLADTNQISKQTSIDPQDLSGQTVGFDQFNNPTDVWEYDFGPGAPGAFLRRSHTDYVTAANYVNANADPTVGAHLRSLPSQQWISSDASGATKASLTIFEYDNYSNDTRHKPLVLRPNLTGHDTAYSGSFTTRGNLTGTTSYGSAQSQSGPVTQSAQFDVAGNVVASLDGLGKTSTTTFGDAFCNGSTCGGTFTANTYAFITTVTSPVPDPTGQHGSTTAFSTTYVYDYWSGHVTSQTDANGQTTTFQYNDVLDRLTAIVRPTGGGRTDFEYGDTVGNLFVRTLNDLDTGRRTESYEYFDALGRVVESRTYENSTQYIAVKKIPFVMQQDPDGVIWLAASQTSNPFRPYLGEQPTWTTTFVDALSRPIKVRTLDNSVLRTTYSGNAVSVSDQAGKVRKSITDALGRLIQVYEDPSGLNYETSYLYDALDNLVKVTQGTQQRFFKYDSLRRLIRSRNSEHGTLASLNLSDPITGNGVWSTGYQYDANNNLIQKTDARGVVSTYTYDAINRQKTVDYSNTSSINPDVTRIYDGATNGKGKLWKTYAGGGESIGSDVEKTLLESYDALGRPSVLKQFFKVNGQWSSNSPYVTSRTYNLAGSVTGQTYPSGRTVTYNYDNAGRLGDKDTQNHAFSGNLGDGQTRTYSKGIVYAPAGQMKQEQFGTATSVYHKLRYNSKQQLAEILTSTTGSDSSWNRGKILNQYSLQCSGAGCNATDNNGNLRKQEVFIPSDDQVSLSTSWYQQYDYDELNRLKRVHEYTGNGALDWQQEFDYDRWGNRTINAASTWIGNQNNPPNPLLNETQFDTSLLASSNRLQAPGDQALSENQRRMRYDGAGNLVKDTYTGSGDRVYDAENRITQAWGGDNQWQYYTYNADGQRTRRKINNQETWQIYGFDGELLAEYPANGAANTPTEEYGYRNSQLLVTAEPATSTNVALASNGAVATASSAYDPVVCSSNAASANDGDRTGRARCSSHVWNDAAPANTFPDWLQIDFNGSKTITEIDVITIQDHLDWPVEPTESMTFSQYGLTAYQVQYWNGSGWVTIPAGNVSGNNKVWRKFTFSAIATTKIRVLTSASPDGYSRIVELEAWTGSSPAPRYDLALGATATASTSYPGWGASAVVNGDRKSLNAYSNGAWSSAAANNFPEWVQVDFGANKTINEIHVFTLQDNWAGSVEPTEAMTFTLYGLSGYEVQYWNGSSWVTVPGGSVTGNNKIWRKFTFSAISTSKIRVLTNASPDGVSRVTEIEAYGPMESGGSGGIHWLVTDQLGTPRMVFDETGSLGNMVRHDYLPFGEELTSQGLRTAPLGYANGDGVRQQFTSKERDLETGMDYFLARYYSSIQGRFTSVDPDNAGAEPSNPQSWNGYGYTFNNPLKFQDPDGLKVRICGTGGQCTDGETDLSDEDFDKYFRHQKDIKIKGGKIYQNGELIGTYQRLSCDECLFGTATFEIERRTAPIPKATAAFAGLSVAAGISGGLALYALQPVTVTVTTLGLATRAAPLLPAVPSAIQKLEKLGLSLQQANAIVQSPASQKLIDNANGGNINVIQEIGGKLVRVTLDPTGQRIVSAGIVRANSITNGIANGRFTPKQ